MLKYFNYDMKKNELWAYNAKDSAITMLARRDLATWNVSVMLLDNFDTWLNHKPIAQCKPETQKSHANFGHLLSFVYVDLGVSFENVSLRDAALSLQPAELVSWISTTLKFTPTWPA